MAQLPGHVTCVALLCSACAMCQTSAQSGNPDEKVFNYKLLIEATLYECDILGIVKDSAAVQVAEPGSIFTVIGKKNDEYIIIRFWKWKQNQSLNYSLCYADSLCLKRKYFLLAAEALYVNAIPRYETSPSFTAGTALVPVKLRLQRFDFSKDITLGPVAGVKFRLSHYTRNYVSILAGLGITSVTLDKQSTDGKIEEPSDVPALTPSLGFVFEFFNTTQAGIFCGWYHVSNNEDLNLIYFGKLWVSFGLGFTIISKGSNDPEMEERKQ